MVNGRIYWYQPMNAEYILKPGEYRAETGMSLFNGRASVVRTESEVEER